MREVWVTGIGSFLPGCDHRSSFWEQVSRGESQLAMEPSPVVDGESIVVGRIGAFDPARYLAEIPERFYARYHRELQIWLAALLGARDDAGIDFARERGERIGLFD